MEDRFAIPCAKILRRFRHVFTTVAAVALVVFPDALSGQAGPPYCAQQPSISDSDADNLSDECELELAQRFAPTLIVQAGNCNWDVDHDRPAGGYFFAAQRVDSAVRIAYLPAYFKDCGWEGPKCWLPGVDCSPHAGDSEFIVVELTSADSSAWTVSGVFLSAHCFGRSGGQCRWYRGRDLGQFLWDGRSPFVWVAAGRNANYPSKDACDQGHHSLDTCDHNARQFRFPVVASRNIGSSSHPFGEGGCISGEELQTPLVETDATECFWTPDAAFRGWQSGAAGVTGYHRYLSEVAGF